MVSLNRARGFAFTAILVTALGVGANTAAFSVADFVLLRPLPFADPDALVRLCEGPRDGGGWGCMNELSPANYRDFKTSSSFEAMGAFTASAVNLVGIGEPRRLETAPVTPEVLPLLGVQPALGRVFDGRQDNRGAAVISHGLWQSQFASDPSVLGRTVRLNGVPHTIIGVMPPAFYFPTRDSQLWTMLTFRDEDYADRTNNYIHGVARLRPGVTFEQSRAELVVIVDRLAREYPDTNEETGISYFAMRDNISPRFRLMLLALGGASLCLLLLTSANLANLLLARAVAREREVAVRAALGAGRQRLMRQLITESVVLTLLGGAAGLAVAAAGVPLFTSLVPGSLPIGTKPGVDLRVLAFAAVFTALTAIGFGLFPAIRAGRRTGCDALREGARAGGGAKQRLRAVLVTVEVTMSVILLITSGLLIRAVWRVQAIDPGFMADKVLAMQTALPRPKSAPGAPRRVLPAGADPGAALPGVQSAAFTSGLPMVMTGIITAVEISGRETRSYRSEGVSHRWVTSQYFRTMGIPFHRGRDLAESDTGNRAWVAVVSSSFAEHYWPGQDSIGRTFGHQGSYRYRCRHRRGRQGPGTRTDQRTAGVSAGDAGARGVSSSRDPKDLVIRHSGPDEALVSAVRQIVRAVDPEQPISEVRPLGDVLARETATRRGQLQVLAVFAVVAILLSAVGIYRLLAYTVSQRAQEIPVHTRTGRGSSARGTDDPRRRHAHGAVRHRARRARRLRGRSSDERLALRRRAGRSRNLRRRRRTGALDSVRRHSRAGLEGRAAHARCRCSGRSRAGSTRLVGVSGEAGCVDVQPAP